MIERQQIIGALHAALEAEPYVRAGWLGGSDATGRQDQWSDVDLQVIVADDRVEDAFLRVEATLCALSPIAVRYRLPEPTWHGHAQEFYQLRDAEPWHLVDFVAMKESAPDRFLERERHGTAHVLFDPDGILWPPALDRAKQADAMRKRLETLRSTFFLFQNLTPKAVWRNDVFEAVSRYQAFTLKPLVDLLRMRHCPDRFDFGLRYLEHDLPADVVGALRELMLPADLPAIERGQAVAEAMFRAELDALDAGQWAI